MMRVLLSTLNAKYIHVNTAIRLLYSLNKDSFPALEWKEFTIKEDPDQIAEECKAYNLVAFSCYIWNITQTLEVCRRIKEKNSNCKILLGGPKSVMILMRFFSYLMLILLLPEKVRSLFLNSLKIIRMLTL